MENYTTFLQSSSTTSHSPVMKSMMMNSNSEAGYFEGDNTQNNGILGLMSIPSVELGNNQGNNNIVINNESSLSQVTTTPNNIVSTSFDIGAESETKSGKYIKERKSKKPKYAFQTRSQVDILDDGYRWRKYGQKAVKNNKFPRSYYRCTHQGCNVKKQVQRLSKDEGMVETTYEGMHSHQIEKSSDNFEHILSQMQIDPSFLIHHSINY
ncbi:DNA-binding transcription factor [Lithospermum erythrorhizon]|uniref:DNA-binding transcription factor n=1 Tax=Lithospermum erythrorhizon TaxID=34254 RepID=A0AAV3P000_LITER